MKDYQDTKTQLEILKKALEDAEGNEALSIQFEISRREDTK